MNNLQPLVWIEDADSSVAQHEFIEYRVIPDHDSFGKFAVRYKDSRHRPATGFTTIADAKEWAWNHYNEKMQPYVKPLLTWIGVNERLPEEDGLYLALRKGFTFEMDNTSDLVPQVSSWNGGRGCFDDDYGNVLITHWMPIPEFKQGE